MNKPLPPLATQYYDLAIRARELIHFYGSVRKAAKAVRISHPYLHRLGKGEKLNPSQGVLKRLGLVQARIYYRIGAEPRDFIEEVGRDGKPTGYWVRG